MLEPFNLQKFRPWIYRGMILLWSISFFSCEKIDTDSSDSTSTTILEIPESQTFWNVSQGGTTLSVQLHSDGVWIVEMDNQASSWISVSPTTGYAGNSIVTLKIEVNWNKEERTGVVTFQSGELLQTVTIIQEGNSLYILPEGENTNDMPVEEW